MEWKNINSINGRRPGAAVDVNQVFGVVRCPFLCPENWFELTVEKLPQFFSPRSTLQLFCDHAALLLIFDFQNSTNIFGYINKIKIFFIWKSYIYRQILKHIAGQFHQAWTSYLWKERMSLHFFWTKLFQGLLHKYGNFL